MLQEQIDVGVVAIVEVHREQQIRVAVTEPIVDEARRLGPNRPPVEPDRGRRRHNDLEQAARELRLGEDSLEQRVVVVARP